jgi:hypothetical protein
MPLPYLSAWNDGRLEGTLMERSICDLGVEQFAVLVVPAEEECDLRGANPLVQTTRRRTQRHRGILGSGSTLIAVEKPERVCRGVQDPLYVAVIARRYEAVTGDVATLIETGETFEVLGARTATEVAPVQGSSSGAPSEVSPELPQAIAPSSARVPAMDEVQRFESARTALGSRRPQSLDYLVR